MFVLMVVGGVRWGRCWRMNGVWRQGNVAGGTPRGVERPRRGSLSLLPALHPTHPTCHPPADTACHPCLSPLPAGPSVLVAPVLKQGAQSVDVFLPGGGWWFDGTTGNWVNAGEL